MKALRSLLAFGVLAIVCSGEPHAAGVYKHVDAQGRVTYSDQPPQQNTGTTEQVQVRAEGAAISVVVDRGYAYCGNLQLGSVEPHHIATQLEYRRNEYERRVQELSAEYRRILQQSLNASPDAAAKMVRDVRRQLEQYQCAERWVQRMRSAQGGVDAALRTSIAKLDGEIAALERRRDDDCGIEPYRGQKGILDSEQTLIWGVWDRCARRYAPDIDALKRERDDHRRAQK